MAEQQVHIALSDGTAVTCIRSEPDGVPIDWLVAYAPGAGSNVHDPFGRYLCRRLAEEGTASLRVQFPYAAAGKRRPDPPRVLEATWRAVIESLRADGRRLVVGGRSMGGRIASHVVAQGEAVDALALFAYPLHPPGNPGRMRDAHLPSIRVPTLFCSGTRDAFATPEELRAAAKKVRGAKLHLLEGADHGFSVPKSSGRTRDDVWSEAAEAMVEWLEKL
ncbi:MAG: alpha/beta family hydrolase [Dehalococcoidia bacterium]